MLHWKSPPDSAFAALESSAAGGRTPRETGGGESCSIGSSSPSAVVSAATAAAADGVPSRLGGSGTWATAVAGAASVSLPSPRRQTAPTHVTRGTPSQTPSLTENAWGPAAVSAPDSLRPRVPDSGSRRRPGATDGPPSRGLPPTPRHLNWWRPSA